MVNLSSPKLFDLLDLRRLKKGGEGETGAVQGGFALVDCPGGFPSPTDRPGKYYYSPLSSLRLIRQNELEGCAKGVQISQHYHYEFAITS